MGFIDGLISQVAAGIHSAEQAGGNLLKGAENLGQTVVHDASSFAGNVAKQTVQGINSVHNAANSAVSNAQNFAQPIVHDASDISNRIGLTSLYNNIRNTPLIANPKLPGTNIPLPLNINPISNSFPIPSTILSLVPGANKVTTGQVADTLNPVNMVHGVTGDIGRLYNSATKNSGGFTPSDPLQKLVFGKDHVGTVGEQGQGISKFLQQHNVPYGKQLGLPLAIGSIATDLFPPLSGKGKVAKDVIEGGVKELAANEAKSLSGQASKEAVRGVGKVTPKLAAKIDNLVGAVKSSGSKEEFLKHLEPINSASEDGKAYRDYYGIPDSVKTNTQLGKFYDAAVKGASHEELAGHLTPPELPLTSVTGRGLLNTKQAKVAQESFTTELDHLRANSPTQDAYLTNLNKLVAETAAKDPGDKSVLAGMRTALSKELNGIVGPNGTYKLNYAMMQEMKKDPEMGKLLGSLEDHIKTIDDHLSTGSFDKNSANLGGTGGAFSSSGKSEARSLPADTNLPLTSLKAEKASPSPIDTLNTVSSRRTNFVTRFNHFTPSQDQYNEYFKEMQGQEPAFFKGLKNTADSVGGKIAYRMKSIESLQKKLQRKNQTSKVKPLGKMDDTLAATITVKSPEDVHQTLEELGKHLTITHVDDFRNNPTFLGYKAIHVDVELPNGAHAEVQINTHEGLVQKDWAHETYEKWRQHIEHNGSATLDDIKQRIFGSEPHLVSEFENDVAHSNKVYNGEIEVPGMHHERVANYIKSSHEYIDSVLGTKPKEDLPLISRGGNGQSSELPPSGVPPDHPVKEDSGKYAFNINKNKLNISDQDKQVLTDKVEAIRPELEEVKGKALSHEEILKDAQASEILSKTISRDETAKATAALTALRQAVSAGAEGKGASEDFVKNLKVLSSVAADAGRTLQSFNIGADATLKTTKEELITKLLGLGHDADKIIEKAKGVDFTDNKQAAAFWREFEKPKASDILTEFRYINLLSSPATHIKKTFSEMTQTGIVKPLTKLASGAIDTFAHAFTGRQQSHYISEVPAYYRGAFANIGTAYKEFAASLGGHRSLDTMGEHVIPSMGTVPSGVAGKLLYPMAKFNQAMSPLNHALEASSQFFRVMIEGGEREALAVKLSQQGRTMTQDEIDHIAKQKSIEAVFRNEVDPTNKSGQGHLLSWIDKMTGVAYKLKEVPGAGWLVPFVRIPMNIFKNGVQYSPLGLASLPGAADKTEQLGKAMIGATVYMGAAYVVHLTDSTWATPTSPKDKEAFNASGRIPYAIKLGDKWVSYSKLGVLGYPIALAAATKFYLTEDPKSVTEDNMTKLQNVLQATAGFFSDQSYVKGIGDIIKAIGGDVAAQKQAYANLPEQVVPLEAFLSWTQRILDPIIRKPNNTIETIESHLPLVSTNVAKAKNTDGTDMTRDLPLTNALSPLNAGQVHQPVENEYKDMNTIQKYKQEDKVNVTAEKQTATQFVKQMQAATSKADKQAIFRQYLDSGKMNDDVAKYVLEGLKKQSTGTMPHDDQTLLHSSANIRANYIYENIKGMSDSDRKQYLGRLIDEKVLNSATEKHLLPLLQGDQTAKLPLIAK